MHACIVKIYGEPETPYGTTVRLVIETDMVTDPSQPGYRQDAINAVVHSANESWEVNNPPAKSWRLISRSRNNA